MAGFNDVIDNVIASQLTRNFSDPQETAVRKQVINSMLEQNTEELHRQRIETVGLIADKLSDGTTDPKVKAAYERLLDKLTT